MNIVWINVLFLATLAIFGGLVAAVGAVLLDRYLKGRYERRERRKLTGGEPWDITIVSQRKSGEDDPDGA